MEEGSHLSRWICALVLTKHRLPLKSTKGLSWQSQGGTSSFRLPQNEVCSPFLAEETLALLPALLSRVRLFQHPLLNGKRNWANSDLFRGFARF